MRLRNPLQRTLMSLLALLCLAPLHAAAQEYPSRPLKLIVPYPAGGSVDLLGRAFAEKMQAALAQPIVAVTGGANPTLGGDERRRRA